MPNSIISEGNTTKEAIDNGLKKLNVSKNMVDIKVLESEDKRSFFSILAPRVVKVELTVKDQKEQTKEIERREIKKNPVSKEGLEKAEEKARNFLNELFGKIDNSIKYNLKLDEFGMEISVTGENTGVLIGYRGETLYALQTIISTVVNINNDEKIRVILDIENYRKKREETLKNLAQKKAKIVEKTGREITLEPMHAYERKIIHSALQESAKVCTKSIGEEPRRRVVISLKK